MSQSFICVVFFENFLIKIFYRKCKIFNFISKECINIEKYIICSSVKISNMKKKITNIEENIYKKEEKKILYLILS